MDFHADKPIYLQIADVFAEEILSGALKGDDRIPSVREYGAQIGVNPNTVMRVYEKLTQEEIIYNKRGIGYPNEFIRLIVIYYMFKYLFGIKTTLLESQQRKKTHLKA